jgi:hypothetical protein
MNAQARGESKRMFCGDTEEGLLWVRGQGARLFTDHESSLRAIRGLNSAHAKIFDFHILIDAVLRSLPAEARLLHSAKGSDFG